MSFQTSVGPPVAIPTANIAPGTAGQLLTTSSTGVTAWGALATKFARVTAQTAAVASILVVTVGAADSSYLVSANVNLTASVTNSFSVTCAYTDETNTPRTLTLPFVQLGGITLVGTITNVTGTGPYEGVPLHIRCKAGTTITFATSGTFASCTYNCEAEATQLA